MCLSVCVCPSLVTRTCCSRWFHMFDLALPDITPEGICVSGWNSTSDILLAKGICKLRY